MVRWKINKTKSFTCPECLKESDDSFNYCPHCGSIMRYGESLSEEEIEAINREQALRYIDGYAAAIDDVIEILDNFNHNQKETKTIISLRNKFSELLIYEGDKNEVKD